MNIQLTLTRRLIILSLICFIFLLILFFMLGYELANKDSVENMKKISLSVNEKKIINEIPGLLQTEKKPAAP